MGHRRSELDGAKRILRQCLGLESDQSLVVILDETTARTGAVLAAAADLEGITCSAFLVPVAAQRRIPVHGDLNPAVQEAAQGAGGLLICVNASPECIGFRDYILETQWSARMRIGHMPGASLAVLRLANTDIGQLSADCHLVEEAMARGHTIELRTYAADGGEHVLTADIDGWSRLPVASDGVIADGVWGNVPSGETYIAPVEETGEGSVVVNGSIPGAVISAGGEVVIRFSRGCVTSIEPAEGVAARHLEKSQIALARAAGDGNWRNLAEIGVGLNPAVRRLTGNMLFDEKAAGTAHIALGDNQFMGGRVKAAIHCDMVSRGPTVLIDNQPIVDRGRLARDWPREHYADIDLRVSPLLAATEVCGSGTEAVTTEDGRLQRTLRPEPGRVSACQVGDDETARLAAAVYRYMPEPGSWIAPDRLAGSTHLPERTVRELLHMLWSYELASYR